MDQEKCATPRALGTPWTQFIVCPLVIWLNRYLWGNMHSLSKLKILFEKLKSNATLQLEGYPKFYCVFREKANTFGYLNQPGWLDVSDRKVSNKDCCFYCYCEAMQWERLMNERLVRSVPSCPWGVSSQPWGREGRTPPLPPQFHLIQPKTIVGFHRNTSSCASLTII